MGLRGFCAGSVAVPAGTAGVTGGIGLVAVAGLPGAVDATGGGATAEGGKTSPGPAMGGAADVDDVSGSRNSGGTSSRNRTTRWLVLRMIISGERAATRS